MKTNHRSIIVFALAAAVLASSCVAHKPYASSVGAPDYNQRVEAKDPQYKKKRNVIGVVVDFGLPVAGAAAGIVAGPMVYQNDQGRQKMTAGNAVLGALVGAGATYVVDKVCGYGKYVPADNKQKWVKDAFGKDYILLSYGGGMVRAINRNVESRYQVKNIGDVEDFSVAFRNSRYESDMLKQALAVIPRGDIPTVVNLYPRSEHAKSFKQQYIRTSGSYSELASAAQKYPDAFTPTELEVLYVDAVKTSDDAIAFHHRYPQSQYSTTVFFNALGSDILDEREMQNLCNAFGSLLPLDKQRVASASDVVRENYYNLMYKVEGPKTTKQVDDFNTTYAWLNFNNKKQTVLSQAWDIAYNSGQKGTAVIAQAGKIVGKKYARDLGIDGNCFKEFVNKELEKEADKIKIVSQYHLSSMSDEFERWKKSAYSAGIIRTGELQFLVYGEIQNTSRFDLPVAVAAGAMVMQTQKVESGGLLGGVINFLGAITGTETSHKQKLGFVRSPNFIIPLLPAGTTMPYAMLIKFKDSDMNGQSGGVNLVDLIKVSSEIGLENIQVQSIVWNDELPGDDVLRAQSEWVQMAVNGMPQTTVIDMFRNKEFRQDTWDEEWSEILRSAASSSSSYSSSSSSSSTGEDNSVPDKATILGMITSRDEWEKDIYGDYWQEIKFSDGIKISICREETDGGRVRYGHPGGVLALMLNAEWYDTYEDAIVALYLAEKE